MDPVARVAPSGENARLPTGPSWRRRTGASSSVAHRPEVDRAVHVTRGEQSAVGRVGEGEAEGVVSGALVKIGAQNDEAPAGLQVPEPNGAVRARERENAADGREGHGLCRRGFAKRTEVDECDRSASPRGQPQGPRCRPQRRAFGGAAATDARCRIGWRSSKTGRGRRPVSRSFSCASMWATRVWTPARAGSSESARRAAARAPSRSSLARSRRASA